MSILKTKTALSGLHFLFEMVRCKAPAPVGAAPMKNKPMRVKRLKLPLTSGAVDKGYFG